MNIDDLRKKGERVKDLSEIVLEGSREFSFQPIYELGRYVSEGDMEFSMIDIEKINCSQELKNDVINLFELLSENILFANLNFATAVIDFVVFDPEDKKGERFHIAICSISAELIEKYISEVQINIDGNKPIFDNNFQVRGPILTNSNIYKSPYFFRGPMERSKYKLPFFHRIKKSLLRYQNEEKTNYENRMKVYFGSFKDNRKNKVDKDIQKAHIEIFFDKIEQELKNGKGLIKYNDKEIEEEKFQFNTSLLIPLLRPAASFVGDKDFRLRGGGLFLYGNTIESANLTELSARLQHFFFRNILNESHTQIVYDYLRHEGANHQIHDFKTFLTSEIRNKVQRVLERDNLVEKDKKELEELMRNEKMFTHYLTEILDAYRNFIQSNSQLVFFGSDDLKKLIIELNSEFDGKISAEFLDKVENEKKAIKVNYIVMKKILRNLYDNTITEYEKCKILENERKVTITWTVSKNSIDYGDDIMIEYYNKGLRINNELIRNFGIIPISGNSTGLGGYFINNTLGWMLAEENKFLDELQINVKRYIKAENDDSGVKFTFKFKLYKR